MVGGERDGSMRLSLHAWLLPTIRISKLPVHPPPPLPPFHPLSPSPLFTPLHPLSNNQLTRRLHLKRKYFILDNHCTKRHAILRLDAAIRQSNAPLGFSAFIVDCCGLLRQNDCDVFRHLIHPEIDFVLYDRGTKQSLLRFSLDKKSIVTLSSHRK